MSRAGGPSRRPTRRSRRIADAWGTGLSTRGDYPLSRSRLGGALPSCLPGERVEYEIDGLG